MGKYMKQYEDLLQRKSSMQKLHNRMLNQYGHLMSDNAKAFNMANWSISE